MDSHSRNRNNVSNNSVQDNIRMNVKKTPKFMQFIRK